MAGLPEATAAEVVKRARECPLLGARRATLGGATQFVLGTAATRVEHPLGRRPEGYVVAHIDQNAASLRDPDSAVTPAADPAREIVLRSTLANTTIQILVF